MVLLVTKQCNPIATMMCAGYQHDFAGNLNEFLCIVTTNNPIENAQKFYAEWLGMKNYIRQCNIQDQPPTSSRTLMSLPVRSTVR